MIETCSGNPDAGLAPGESQTVTIELDYGDFRGLILRVEPGTIPQQDPPFGLAQQGGDFDCRDQRRLPFCHPELTTIDWFDAPAELEDVIYVTVHQEGNAATVMNYEANFGQILAMGGFIPSAEFSNGDVVQQVAGEYCDLPGGVVSPNCEPTGENLAPIARFTSICSELTCTFDASGSTDDDGTIAAYDWTFGEDGSTASGVEVERTYATPGPFSVTLTVTDDDGDTGTLTQTIQVPGATNDPPIAAFTFSCDTLTCNFDATGSEDPNGTISSYDWDFGDGNTGTGVMVSHTYAAGGTYTVTLTVTDNDLATGSTSQSVTVEEEASGGISLSVTPERVRGLHQVELTWSGATTTTVDIHRGTQLIATVANDPGGDNTHLDRINARGRGTYTYLVCEAGSSTACSEPATAVFN